MKKEKGEAKSGRKEKVKNRKKEEVERGEYGKKEVGRSRRQEDEVKGGRDETKERRTEGE
ncbi:hypothetical protein CHS0354_010217 [Potamilus streckersoni]|uniref:Uncharacterized protein n=1 Tax=Potamilus streckersoni TaxID=2493646 RepID=A0AAE0RSF4_9BIVA|nr:hypothetical protein CHS0354_010217 [Potamilus streckersoni]